MSNRELITLEDGTKAYKYDNGALQAVDGPKAGKMIGPPDRSIIEEKPREMARRRWEKAAEKAREHILEEARKGIYPSAKDAPDAWGWSVAQLWADAQDKDNSLNQRVTAMEFVGRGAATLADRRTGNDSQAPQVVVMIDASVAEYLEQG